MWIEKTSVNICQVISALNSWNTYAHLILEFVPEMTILRVRITDYKKNPE